MRDFARRAASEFTFIDLFAGAGGFSEGLLLATSDEARFKLVAASDIHSNACSTHENRFKKQLGLDYKFFTDDIRSPSFLPRLLKHVSDVAGTTIDVIVGGPPCQGFSMFGKRNESDPRNDLFLPYLKVIAALRPKYFVIENVPGLAMMYEGKVVDRIREEVKNLKPTQYDLSGPIKVNAADFGVPQIRERLLFIGNRKDLPSIKHIPRAHTGDYITVADALSDLSFLRAWESNGTYSLTHLPGTDYQTQSREGRLFHTLGIKRLDSRLANHDAARHTPDVIARFAMVPAGKGFEAIPKLLWDEHLRSSKKWCVRLRGDKPSYTVTTLPDDLIHYEQHRILTVREMARLQSFDDTFEFLGPRSSGGGGKGNKKRTGELPQYTQVGNAVPPLLARGIGFALLKSLQLECDSCMTTSRSSRVRTQPVAV